MIQLILYTTEDGLNRIQLRAEGQTVWLTQLEMAELFSATKQNISLHLKNLFEEGELDEQSVVKESLTTAADGKYYRTRLYNLDAILAVGYRVRSPRGTQFRRWATTVLSEYLRKGFVMDDERLKNPDGRPDYFDEMLARIRDIRASEKRFYQKVRDLFALSSDEGVHGSRGSGSGRAMYDDPRVAVGPLVLTESERERRRRQNEGHPTRRQVICGSPCWSA